MAAPLAAATTLSDGVRLRLRVTPNAGRDALEGPETRDDGTQVLRLRVRAVADQGRANAAVVALLARTLHVPKAAVRIVAGESARIKLIEVRGDPVALLARLPPAPGS